MRHGVREAVVQAQALPIGPRLREQVHAFLTRRAQGGGFTHFGVGIRPGDTTAVGTIILTRRRVELTPIRPAVGRPLAICGRLLSGQRPRIYVTLPSRRILKRSPRPRGGSRFCARVPAARRGRYQIEIMVDSVLGPEVAALFPLFVGVAPPTRPTHKVFPEEPASGGHVEIRLMQMLNRSRQSAGLPRLQPSRALASVARAHSADMLLSGYFGHISPTFGDLDRRLSTVGMEYSHASENLALSTSPKRAHYSLVESPSHLSNMLDPSLTHVGIGVAHDPERQLLYVTQCFATDLQVGRATRLVPGAW
jgi:uncharacterized protein YkwD